MAEQQQPQPVVHWNWLEVPEPTPPSASTTNEPNQEHE